MPIDLNRAIQVIDEYVMNAPWDSYREELV